MEKWKRIGHKLLLPPPAVLALLLPVATVLLVYVLTSMDSSSPVAYGADILSCYTLVALCARLPRLWRWGRSFRARNRYLRRYDEDRALRVRLSLYLSLGLNTAYAAMQAYAGAVNHSAWFYVLAAYYLLLGAMRFVLLRYSRKNDLGQVLAAEYRRYRLCGLTLLLMNTTLSAMVFYMVWQNRGFVHGRVWTIAMAAYTFYIFTKAICNQVRYRRDPSPVIAAAKVISLVAALVSMLSLETAMLSAFGGAEDLSFRRWIIGTTGGVVCVVVLFLAIDMVVRANRALRQLPA